MVYEGAAGNNTSKQQLLLHEIFYWLGYLAVVHTKTKSELELPRMGWNQQERVETTWNMLQPPGTRWDQLVKDTHTKLYEGIVCAMLSPNGIKH